MQRTQPLFRESQSQHDDVAPRDWFDTLDEWIVPPARLPDPPRSLHRFEVSMTVIPPEPTFPATLDDARLAVAAKHGIQCLDVSYRLPTDALDLVDVLVALRESGLEAWAKSAPYDATLIRVFTRENVLSMIDPDVLTRAREAADDMLAEQAMPDDVREVA